MDKTTWYVFTTKDSEGGLYAYAEGIKHGTELTWIAQGKETMNACDSKKEAIEIAVYWNECYINNGSASKWIMPKVA